jgi:hypothetical protein
MSSLGIASNIKYEFLFGSFDNLQRREEWKFILILTPTCPNSSFSFQILVPLYWPYFPNPQG